MSQEIINLQRALRSAGYDVTVDGIAGPKTRGALVDYEASQGAPPWLLELASHMFMHEVSDNAALRKWLRSDGTTLGDPAAQPWCGDAMETAIKNTLPDEPFYGPMQNPYWARNWAHFGEETEGRDLGDLVVMTRGNGGHIAALVGRDDRRGLILIRGGNQSNMINDMWVDVARVINYRKPITYNKRVPRAPYVDSRGGKISINEA